MQVLINTRPAQRRRLATAANYGLLLTTVAAVMLFEAKAPADMFTLSPVYSQTFGDAITGDNQFTSQNGRQSWFVNTGADNYFDDYYERPTIQDYDHPVQVASTHPTHGTDSELNSLVGQNIVATNSSGPSYFEYIDITRGLYGFDKTHLYLGIELYGDKKVAGDGTRTSDFGESAYYRVRMSKTLDGAYGLMLSAEAAAAFQTTEFFNPAQQYSDQKAFGYLDTNGDVGGAGGVFVTGEAATQPLNGFSEKVISDGNAEAGNKPQIMYTRRTTNVLNGRPMVEIALNYQEFNRIYSDPKFRIDPNNLFLIYEANRGGPKDNQNYLWNDKYSFDEAGTPYDHNNQPQNVYELDTLRALGSDDITTAVPEPASFALLGLASVAGLGLRSRRKRESNG